EGRWLNRRFFTFHQKNRPYIILKWAQTADGYLDDCGKPLAISTPFTKMLVHKLRAEEDAIVVGRVTDEREHPKLNVREWAGKSPVRFVLSSKSSKNAHSIEEILQKCREQQLQSLIVEGGWKTLQSFIDQNLWDEIRVETADGFHLTADSSTPAPLLPPNATLFLQQGFGSNIINYYKK
ncbi:MAG: dihydrofolate reductase family protein, partial [Prevotella sp.]|nr:dihydrofolate reductase family protein [Prevotella sp.]